ncbi:MltR family transcriptional regulator [Vibrio sp. JC009]|uniref:MltR family transcriptional regulator n=1 Tax=Vibrio sp. JC009 TaxID=2912314 RepID=UPI0023B0B8A8|nr:MltR family transcriptional regulator [Vibrio sp. JC009]WED23122.1 MltR family transcriptional regulator [Vibrio sp. JC009]
MEKADTNLFADCSTPLELIQMVLAEITGIVDEKYGQVVQDNSIMMPEVGRYLVSDAQPVYTIEVKMKMLNLFNKLEQSDLLDIKQIIQLEHALSTRESVLSFSDPAFFNAVKKLQTIRQEQLLNFDLIQLEDGIDHLFFQEEVTLQNTKIKTELIIAMHHLLNNINH